MKKLIIVLFLLLVPLVSGEVVTLCDEGCDYDSFCAASIAAGEDGSVVLPPRHGIERFVNCDGIEFSLVKSSASAFEKGVNISFKPDGVLVIKEFFGELSLLCGNGVVDEGETRESCPKDFVNADVFSLNCLDADPGTVCAFGSS